MIRKNILKINFKDDNDHRNKKRFNSFENGIAKELSFNDYIV